MRTPSDSFAQLGTLVSPLLGFSFVSNMAVLISPLFMMQVLDRVIPSGNLNTLLMLLGIALLAVTLNSFVDFNRDIALGRAARWVDRFCMQAALSQQGKDRQQAIEAVLQLRGFFQPSFATSVLNLPWIPLFLGAIFLIHPLFLVLIACIVASLFLVKKAAEFATRTASAKAATAAGQASETLTDITENIATGDLEIIVNNLSDRFITQQDLHHQSEDHASRISTLATAISAGIRTGAQLSALSLGAFLVVSNELSAGGMIGASIICAKTIGAAEQAINSYPRIQATRKAVNLIRKYLGMSAQRTTEVSDLSGGIRCENLLYPRGGGAEPRLSRISFDLAPGECLAIIGDSGSGKTTLLHALCAIDPAPIGTVFLDESAAQTLGPETLRKMVGYLPQQAQLLSGSISDNIACFAAQPDDDRIINAAKSAGVHALISALPQAYDTDIAENRHLLSAGQKQRVALARAIYENPRYLFLDEPNALLDAQGERQLCDTLARLKKSGVTIVMSLHRSGIMGLADKVLLLDQGKLADFGPRAEVLGRRTSGSRRLVLPVNAAALLDLADWVTSQFMRNTDEAFCQKAILAATEMFNATCLNGPTDVERKVTFTFKFEDTKTCNIRLVDSFTTDLEAKLPKIRSLVRHPDVDMIDIDADELALAVVVQLTDSLQAMNAEETSVLDAWLSSDSAKRPQHSPI